MLRVVRTPGAPSVASSPRTPSSAHGGRRWDFLTRSHSDLSELGQSLIQEQRADNHGSLAKQIRPSSSKQSLSRYKREDEETVALHATLHASARVREECQHIMATDGEATVRSRQVAATLQKMLRRLESAAAAATSVSQMGAAEREATIEALENEVRRNEAQLTRTGYEARESMHAVVTRHGKEMDILRLILQTEMRDAELVSDFVEAAHKQAEADRRWKEGEEERARLAADKAQKARVDHLQWAALTKLMNLQLAFGWHTWLDSHLRKQELRRRAIVAFRNRGLLWAMVTWKEAHPPKTLFRRIGELEDQLKQSQEHATKLAAELRAAKRDIASREELDAAENEKRVLHLQGHAARRMRKLQVARAMSSWIDLYAFNQSIKARAIARFTNQSLYAALRIWREVHPPRIQERLIAGPLLQRVHELEAQLKEEHRALVKLRAASAKLFAEKDYVREMAKQCEILSSLVEHQQRCLSEALQATSWTGCRQLLYHESLRYVQSAATHGKTIERAHRRELIRQKSSGVLVDGEEVERMKRNGFARAEDARRGEIHDREFASDVIWGGADNNSRYNSWAESPSGMSAVPTVLASSPSSSPAIGGSSRALRSALDQVSLPASP